MKQRLLWTIGFIVLAMSALAASPANAQTTAVGPYYVPPSWDQSLPSNARFIVLSNMSSAAVLDRETGLVWEKSPNTMRVTWQIARLECNRKTVGNRRGWRLPTVQELASLVDPSVPHPGNTGFFLTTGHPFEMGSSDVPTNFFWSITASFDIPNGAWTVPVGPGGMGVADRSTTWRVWCVRGGQGADIQ